MTMSDDREETMCRIETMIDEPANERTDALRLDELRRVFASVNADLQSSRNSDFNRFDGSTTRQTWNAALKRCFRAFRDQLSSRVAQGSKPACRTMFGLVASCPILQDNGSQIISARLVKDWVQALAAVPPERFDRGLRATIENEFLAPYDDVQYNVLVALTSCACEAKDDRLDNKLRPWSIYYLLIMHKGKNSPTNSNLVASCEIAHNDDDDSMSSIQGGEAGVVRQHRSSLQASSRQPRLKSLERAWLAFLCLDLDEELRAEAFQFVAENILTCIPRPLRFAACFMDAFDRTQEPMIAVVALDGLFHLVTQHGFEHKDFYRRLYALITPEMFHSRYKVAFVKLVNVCLARNEMLPAHTAAAFVKRLVRCGLKAPPSAAWLILCLAFKVLSRHSETMCLTNRECTAELGIEDPYDPLAMEPSNSNAIHSSLWELNAYSNHYLSSISTLASSTGIGVDLVIVDECFGYSYRSLFESERKRKRSDAPLAFHRPSKLASKGDCWGLILD